MNFKEILELIDRVAERGLHSLEIEQAGVRLKIEGKRTEGTPAVAFGAHIQSGTATPAPPTAAPSEGAASVTGGASLDEAALDSSWHVITSPIVGTFYRSPNPESDVFVNEGDRVMKAQVLCIIEAMKLMNEIESDFDGVVMKVFPQNGQPVEYGERLFALKP